MIADEDLFSMRAPCPGCGYAQGFARMSSGQDVVRCANCGRLCYNRPKSESGRERRSVRSRPQIAPETRARILNRDSWRCVVCGRGAEQGVILHIGHCVSDKEGRELGLTEEELYSDDNLVAICEEENLGQGSKSIELRLLWAVMRRRRWPA